MCIGGTNWQNMQERMCNIVTQLNQLIDAAQNTGSTLKKYFRKMKRKNGFTIYKIQYRHSRTLDDHCGNTTRFWCSEQMERICVVKIKFLAIR